MATNAGYRIIMTANNKGCNYVLGRLEKNEQYVTWWKINDKTYMAGHYFNTYDEAVNDLIERAEINQSVGNIVKSVNGVKH